MKYFRTLLAMVASLVAIAACHGGNSSVRAEAPTDTLATTRAADSLASRAHRQFEQCRVTLASRAHRQFEQCRVSSTSGIEMTKCLVQFDWSGDSAKAAGQGYQFTLDVAYRDELVGRLRNEFKIACMPKDSVESHVRDFIKAAGDPPNRKGMDYMMNMEYQLAQSLIELRAAQGQSGDCK